MRFIPFVLALLAGATTSACAQTSPTPFAQFSSPYYVFQYGPGENWVEGYSVFEQDISGHFQYMAQLENEGVLLHGGPLDRGNGGYALGVIVADNLDAAHAIITQDPALQNGVHRLISIDRWIAAAGSDGTIDPSRVGPANP